MISEYLHRPVNHFTKARKIRSMTRDFFSTFGKRVRILREDRGWTQEHLADLLGDHGVTVRNTWISTLEKAKENKLPATDVVVALARALNTTTDYLLMLSDDPQTDATLLPANISHEADEAASLIDELRDPIWRGYCVTAVREVCQEYEKRNTDLARLSRTITDMRTKGATELAAHIERQLNAIAAIADWSTARRELDALIRFLGSDS